MKLFVSVLFLFLLYRAHSEIWAVLVAGSDTWYNYRHQADICHSYHLLRNGGVPANRIIVMAYDDIAQSSSNPVKGKIFNKKTTGTPEDVYAGCIIDYKGKDVTPKNYIAILKGDEASVKGIGTGRVLKSTANDNVFLYFSDHGSTGLIAFPSEYMYADSLLQTIQYMHDKSMYKKLVYYLEACESGSMFTKLASNIGAYAITAANDHESSWAFYCPPNDDIVGTTHIGTCLGDEFSVQWMEDSDAVDRDAENLQKQFEVVKQKTVKSQVCQFGDKAFATDPISAFQGKVPKVEPVAQADEATPVKIDSRDVKLLILQRQAQITDDPVVQISLQREITQRSFYDSTFSHLQSIYGVQTDAITPSTTDFDCYRSLMDFWTQQCGHLSDYGLKYGRFFYTYCSVPEEARVKGIIEEIDHLC